MRDTLGIPITTTPEIGIYSVRIDQMVYGRQIALSGIDIELADEFAGFGEFHDFAGLGRIGVDRVAVSGHQVSVRGQHERQRPAQMTVLGNHRAPAGAPGGVLLVEACGTAKIALSAVDAT
jgi:hypothetical protein